MRKIVSLFVTVLVVLSFLLACASPTPTVAPTKPSVPAATTAPPAAPTAAPPPSGTTAPPAAATKPVAAAPTTTPVAKIKRGGTLRIGDTFTVTGLDPQISTGYALSLYVIYETLLKLERVGETDRFEVKPELAESWDMIDPKTIVLKLRKGVKFHDGSEWNAEVAKWNVDRWLTHQKFVGKHLVRDIDSAQVVDSYTLKLNLKQASAPSLYYLTPGSVSTGDIGTMVVSKDAVEKLGEDQFASKPSGTGPFQLENWLRDDHMNLKAYPQYWRMGEDGKQLPYLDGFVWRYRPDVTVTLLELKSGHLDLAYWIPEKDLTSIKANPDLVLSLLNWSSRVRGNINFNTKRGPFKDNLKLRQAAWYALEREGIAKALGFGFAKAHAYPLWTPGMLGYDENLPRYDYNQAKAKSLMTEAGYANGLDVMLTAISRQPDLSIMQTVKSSWDAVGIRTTIDALERTAAIQKTTSGDFEIYMMTASSAPDPDSLGAFILPKGNTNRIQYENSEVTKLMAEGRAIYDAAKREDIYKRVLRIVNDDAYYGSLYLVFDNIATQKYVKNVKVQFNGQAVDCKDVWLDK